jgi:Caspase domain/Domain of unknown function (DUF4384)
LGYCRRMLSPAVPLLCALICHTAAARNVALLVAVGQFKDPALKTHQLLGPAIDIDSMQRALTGRWGFLPGDVRTLRDQEATHERVLSEIAELEQRSAPGDTVVIYFSGHGTSANDNDNNFDLPYATGAWVPYDLDFSSTSAAQRTLIVGRRDLVPRLKRLDQGGRWVVVISDSCYSGQVVRAFGETHSKTRFLDTRDLGVARPAAAAVVSARLPPPPYPYQHVVLLSGASDSETGQDISTMQGLQQAPTLDGKFHGAFTDAFLRLLDGQLLPGTFNYSQGREAMSAFLEHRNFAQHPQLLPAIAEDPQDVGSRPFLGMNLQANAGAQSNASPNAAPGTAANSAPGTAANTGAHANAVATLHLRLESVSAALQAKIAAVRGVTIVERDADLILRQRGDQADLTGPAGDPIVSAKAGDPKLIKRIAAQVWLNRALPPGSDSLGLRADTDPGSRGNTFVQCESFAFEVRLQKPAYVMLLDLDSDGNLTVLYPARASERHVVAGGAPQAIPADPKDRILVVPPFGSDQVAVLAFEKLPDFFVDLTGAQRFGADDARAETLAKGFAGAAGAIGVQQITVHTYAATGKVFCGS